MLNTKTYQAIVLLMAYWFILVPVNACGGFFCQLLPINQAAEQIIFRQDGDQITTMVQITYSGNAEDFGWVLPVPNTPTLAIGSDITFGELERATRPQFILTREGEACPIESDDANEDGAVDVPEDSGDTDITIEQTLTVGPFDAQIISSDDPEALANWLADNNLDLSERGVELLTPYIDDNMKFVVLKLQSDKTSGDIQPIILNYSSDKPVIPIRLTAVAAEDDMGVLVWLLGDSRAVPDNYLHVIPNYTRLNWYTGTRNAYASYQSLITQAMNEAGGQGFATDLAGRIENLTDGFTTAQLFSDRLTSLEDVSSAEFIQQLWNTSVNSIIVNAIANELPLPEGQNNQIYADVLALTTQYTDEELANARTNVTATINEQLVSPLQNSIDILDDNLYLTRLYTTISADEMSSDPSFVFNPDMPGQAQERQATLTTNCNDGNTEWSLTLGSGTGREDTVVINARSDEPRSAQATSQDASWQIAKTSAQGFPEITEQRNFTTEVIGNFGAGGDSGSINALILIILLALIIRRYVSLGI